MFQNLINLQIHTTNQNIYLPSSKSAISSTKSLASKVVFEPSKTTITTFQHETLYERRDQNFEVCSRTTKTLFSWGHIYHFFTYHWIVKVNFFPLQTQLDNAVSLNEMCILKVFSYYKWLKVSKSGAGDFWIKKWQR